jgi:beta-lactam-binding protein with PASTA domain
MKAVVLLAAVLALSACGAKAKSKPPQHAAIPDVRGLNAPDAAARLIDARYCVRLARGTPPADDARPKPGKFTTVTRMPVERQSPPAGVTRRPWSMVTLTVGGISKHASSFIDVWDGGAKIPCPEISTTR